MVVDGNRPKTKNSSRAWELFQVVRDQRTKSRYFGSEGVYFPRSRTFRKGMWCPANTQRTPSGRRNPYSSASMAVKTACMLACGVPGTTSARTTPMPCGDWKVTASASRGMRAPMMASSASATPRRPAEPEEPAGMSMSVTSHSPTRRRREPVSMLSGSGKTATSRSSARRALAARAM